MRSSAIEIRKWTFFEPRTANLRFLCGAKIWVKRQNEPVRSFHLQGWTRVEQFPSTQDHAEQVGGHWPPYGYNSLSRRSLAI